MLTMAERLPVDRMRKAASAFLGFMPLGLPFVAMALFVNAGEIKGDKRLAGLPDLTAVMAGLVALLVARNWMKGRRFPALLPPLAMAAWFLTFLPGVLQVVGSVAAQEKITFLFSLTLLAAFAPMVLLRSRDDLRRAVAGFALVGVLFTAQALWNLLTVGPDADGRLTVFGSTTITLGRHATYLMLYSAVILWDPRESLRTPVALPLLLVAAFISVSSGSRGPLGAGVITLAFMLLFPGPKRKLWGPKTLIFLAALPFIASASLVLMPKTSVARIEMMIEGRSGYSDQYRKEAAAKTFEHIQSHPLGTGFGSFPLEIEGHISGHGRTYPHNILLELALEAGWAAGLTMLALVFGSLFYLWRHCTEPGPRMVFIGLFFSLINCLVSGDVNDNRALFFHLALALCAPYLPDGSGAAGTETA